MTDEKSSKGAEQLFDKSWVDPTKPMRFEDGIPTNLFAGLMISQLITLGREDTYAGSPHKPEIPFPDLEVTSQQQTEAMFRYVTQRDIINYLDWNLNIRDATSHIISIENELKDPNRQHFSYAGTRKDKERLLVTWCFVRDNLDDPRLVWLKKVDKYRREELRQKALTEKSKSPLVVSSTHPGLEQDSLPQPPKLPEETLWQEVVEKHKIGEWIIQNFQHMPPGSVLESFANMAKMDPSYQSQADVIRYICEHLDEFPEVVKVIEDRKRGTTK